MDIEQLNLILADYTMDMVLPRTYFLSQKKRLERVSYSLWAVDKLKEHIISGMCGKTRASINYYIFAIENFMQKMDDYSRLNATNSFMFSTANDIAADILDLFMAMK